MNIKIPRNRIILLPPLTLIKKDRYLILGGVCCFSNFKNPSKFEQVAGPTIILITMDRDRKSMTKRGSKNQYYDRRRKPEDEWSKGNTSYTKPKKKYGGRYDSRDYDYQYIHKDRKQYSREELLKLAANACIDGDVLDQLTVKYDLVFSEELRKPIGDIQESKEDRFVDTSADNDKGFDRRDDYDRGDHEKYPKRKEFVRFEGMDDHEPDFEKLDTYLEKKYKQDREDEEELPAWATEDYEGETPLWDDVDTDEIKKQTKDSDDWTTSNIKTINKNELKSKFKGNYDSEDDDGYRRDGDEDDDPYDYSPKKNNKPYQYDDDSDDRDGHNEYRIKKNEIEPTNKTYDTHDSGKMIPENAENLSSLLKKWKKEEEDESKNLGFQEEEEELINANFYEEELREKRRELALQSGNYLNTDFPKNEMTRPSNIGAIGLNRQTEPQKHPVNNLSSILGVFTEGDSGDNSILSGKGHNISRNHTNIQDPAILNSKSLSDEIGLIVGPPPSVIPEEKELDEKTEKDRKEFQEKYLSMDKALSQIVYDTLNSRMRQTIDMCSTNGINQISVEKYCANNYKIFSFLMQGVIFTKTWHYKDKVGNVQGPYMSFDMDIWNGEGKYFSKNLAISPNKKDYFPLSMYLERDQNIVDMMPEVIENHEKKIDQQQVMMKMMYQQPYNSWVPPPVIGNAPVSVLPFPKPGVQSTVIPVPIQQQRKRSQMEMPGPQNQRRPNGSYHQSGNQIYQRKTEQPNVISLLNMDPAIQMVDSYPNEKIEKQSSSIGSEAEDAIMQKVLFSTNFVADQKPSTQNTTSTRHSNTHSKNTPPPSKPQSTSQYKVKQPAEDDFPTLSEVFKR